MSKLSLREELVKAAIATLNLEIYGDRFGINWAKVAAERAIQLADEVILQLNETACPRFIETNDLFNSCINCGKMKIEHKKKSFYDKD